MLNDHVTCIKLATRVSDVVAMGTINTLFMALAHTREDIMRKKIRVIK